MWKYGSLLALAFFSGVLLDYYREASHGVPGASVPVVVFRGAPVQVQPVPAPASQFWPKIEGEDYGKCITDLRSIGCPEPVISFIVKGYLFAAYQAKVNAIFDPLAKYWNTPEENGRIAAAVAAIRAERDSKLAGLKLVPTGELAMDGLSPASQKHVAEALKQYPKTIISPNSTAEEWRQFLGNRAARVAYLAQFLSPDELLAYRINQDGNAEGIARLLRPINPTEQEFENVFLALDGQNLNQTNGMLSPDVEALLQKALGDQRYAEYQSQMAPENFIFNNFAETFNLTDDQIQRLQQVRSSYGSMSFDDYHAAVSAIIQNPIGTGHYFAIPPLYAPKGQ